MDIVQELTARGLVADKTAELSEIFSKGRTVYVGIDPTAGSAQVGNLALFLTMKRMGMAGHTLIFLVGGATGMIGDPKEKGERALLARNTARANARALKKQLRGLMGNTPFRMVDNADWLLKVPLVSFLRDIGKHFTVNELIKRDTIRRRLETPDESISYTEFTYALLQGYDYLILNKKYGCDLQIGGSDQWTNILSGVELLRRKEQKQVYALTMPLVTDALGKKFGKSEGNTVWLDPKKTSPFLFYQFWVNQPDDMLETYLKFYTFLSLEEIKKCIVKHEQDPSARWAQMTLALKVTQLVHGKTAAESAAAAAALFGGAPFSSLSRKARSVALSEVPTLKIKTDTLITTTLVDGKLAASKGEARRLMEGKGISLNGKVILTDRQLSVTDFADSLALLKKGKRDILVLVLK